MGSTILQFQELANPTSERYDKNILGVSFKEYVDSSLLEKNFVTRSIVCKSKDEVLTTDDYLYAKEFLETRCNVQLMYGHEKALIKFVEKFKNIDKNSLSIQDFQCLTEHVKIITNLAKNVADVQYQIEQNMDSLATISRYDMMLFFDVVNSKIS